MGVAAEVGWSVLAADGVESCMFALFWKCVSLVVTSDSTYDALLSIGVRRGRQEQGTRTGLSLQLQTVCASAAEEAKVEAVVRAELQYELRAAEEVGCEIESLLDAAKEVHSTAYYPLPATHYPLPSSSFPHRLPVHAGSCAAEHRLSQPRVSI